MKGAVSRVGLSWAVVCIGLLACGSGDDDPAPADAGQRDAGAQQAVIRQVMLSERVVVGEVMRTRLQLAFGVHPDLPDENDDGQVTNALPYAQKVYVIFNTQVSNVNEGEGSDARLRSGAATVICDGIEIPLRLDRSYYTPFGSQELDPGDNPVSGLGPAVYIFADHLRTGSTCGIELADDVVGPNGEPVCAPPGGDPTQSCTPGDTSLVSFGVMELQVLGTAPADGAMNVNLTAQILLQFNTDLDPTTVDSITLSDPAGVIAAEAAAEDSDPAIVSVTVAGELQPATQYTVNVASGPNGLRDTLGGTLPEDHQFSFTTVP